MFGGMKWCLVRGGNITRVNFELDVDKWSSRDFDPCFHRQMRRKEPGGVRGRWREEAKPACLR